MKSTDTIRNRIAKICEQRARDGWKFSKSYWMGAQECGCVVSAVNYPASGFTMSAALKSGISMAEMFSIEAGFCGWDDDGLNEQDVAMIADHPELYDFGCELAEIYLQ